MSAGIWISISWLIAIIPECYNCSPSRSVEYNSAVRCFLFVGEKKAQLDTRWNFPQKTHLIGVIILALSLDWAERSQQSHNRRRNQPIYVYRWHVYSKIGYLFRIYTEKRASLKRYLSALRIILASIRKTDTSIWKISLNTRSHFREKKNKQWHSANASNWQSVRVERIIRQKHLMQQSETCAHNKRKFASAVERIISTLPTLVSSFAVHKKREKDFWMILLVALHCIVPNQWTVQHTNTQTNYLCSSANKKNRMFSIASIAICANFCVFCFPTHRSDKSCKTRIKYTVCYYYRTLPQLNRLIDFVCKIDAISVAKTHAAQTVECQGKIMRCNVWCRHSRNRTIIYLKMLGRDDFHSFTLTRAWAAEESAATTSKSKQCHCSERVNVPRSICRAALWPGE